MAKICGLMLLVLVGCSAAVESTPEKPVDVQAFIAGVDVQARAITAKQDQAIASIEATRSEIVSQNRQIIDTLKTLKASLSAPKPNGEEVIKSAPNPPAKANTAPAPIKVATPGDFSRITSDGTRLRWNIEGNWNPTILETSAHLREHGIDTNGMTHQEMANIHASIHEGKPVATKAKVPVMVNRGSSCPGGVCPTNTRQRKGLFGWRR